MAFQAVLQTGHGPYRRAVDNADTPMPLLQEVSSDLIPSILVVTTNNMSVWIAQITPQTYIGIILPGQEFSSSLATSCLDDEGASSRKRS